ncbi:hypothetical protein PIB30_025535 [Stylosanthes scabra]|uniref:F-box associated beta-propeller type 1 domain-containing protein n=1 Tax=Stylosanthes scabra TaxID=79078 RepID=A0ABU6ZBL6_9FABA|nr:hypothetical protein [Stylosanthes scabra]
MSDIAPRSFRVPQLPDLPDEVKLIPLGCSIYAHFGFVRPNMGTSDWVMKMDPLTGEQNDFLLPFIVINRGWYRIVGVDNGVFCVRYSSLGLSSHLLIWNPTTYSSRVIPDPPRHHCKDYSYLYSFAHFPNNVNYAVVHIFKQRPDTPSWRLAIYSSVERNWVVNMECPTFVRRLDPCYASLNGVLYWLHWNIKGTDTNPPYIVMERHMEMPQPEEPNNAKLSVFHLTRYSPASRTKRSLNMVEFQDMVKIRSLDKTCATIFPV